MAQSEPTHKNSPEPTDMKKKPAAPSLPEGTAEPISVDQLHLDARNPRLVEYSISLKEGQDKILEILWDKVAVDEVAMSIAASGYWQYEPLLVTQEDGRT